MASINGISLKALKSFRGLECESWQGNLYLNNKKIGFWSQDGDGGPDRFELDCAYSERKLEKALKEAQNIKNDESFMFMELFMEKLFWLTESHKAYKKTVKQGYSTVVEITDGYHTSHLGCLGHYADLSDDRLLTELSVQIEDIKEQMYENEEKEIKIYRSSDDFVIGKSISLNDIKRD